MSNEASHPTEKELLLIADGELSSLRSARVRIHLAACPSCRSRMVKIEAESVEFQRIFRQTLDPKLPPIVGSRVLLKTRLHALATQQDIARWRWLIPSPSRTAICLYLTIFVVAATGLLLKPHRFQGSNTILSVDARDAVPNPSLTPGATRQVAVRDLCSMPHEQVVKEVPSSLRQKVLQEYGIGNTHPDDYEIDYLVTPGLGGTDNIHNLWPEPYKTLRWNARVKDALEEHLHQMVCSGKLPLPTAQREISTNWIAAYKKYFHTDKPLRPRPDRTRWLGIAFAPATLLVKLDFK